MIKLEQRFKKDDVLRNNYFNFMGKSLNNGHAVIVNPAEEVPSGKVWYQSHFCINTSKKFRVVFDCLAKFQGVSVNNPRRQR